MLAWTHRQQQLGGFVDAVIRGVETNGASSPPLMLDDIDSVFIHECVTVCNIRVLQPQEAQLESGLLSLCLRRFLRTCEVPAGELEIKAFCQGLKVFVLKGMLFERALKIIVEEHFSGLRILYYLSAAAPREAETITALARANAELALGSRLTAYPLIAMAIRLGSTSGMQSE